MAQMPFLAPQLRQSLKILQVPAIELRSTVIEELQTNPALEEIGSNDISIDTAESIPSSKETEAQDDGTENPPVTSNDNWEDSYEPPYQGQAYSKEAAEKRQFFFDSIKSETSAQEQLMRQAKLTDADEETLKALEYLIGNLDDRGFLTVEPGVVAEQSEQPIEVVLKALRLLKTLDPQGLGSRDLQECLLTQLDQQGMGDTLAGKILRNQFPLFLRRRIPELSRALEVDTARVEDALRMIAELDPAPGRNFAEDTNRVIIPDVRVFREGEKWQMTLTRDYLPRLRLSSNFKKYLSDKRLSGSEREFLQEKLKAGRQLIAAIELRQQTIERISRLLLEIQIGFFEHGVEKLKPLTMSQIAEKIGVHETTISRAIANKYMSTPHGVFPFKFFFTPGYTIAAGESVSNKSIKDRIQGLIEAEDSNKPLSDQAIAEMLKKTNVNIARRTVAKYREELEILPTHLRRQFKD
jgi:RNA polymerase sigma-54 factor